ncbi:MULTISPECIES: BppU family phage baseplate upper protein [Lactobacillus]|uniref:Tail protein n=2 Tax=root TaxID=1 RepID=A0A8S5MSL5_9CAUD|nr:MULTISPECIES: BppU family phage baseplate upper protein [Lactobacillus]DAD85313.1 MAG TPA: tail protein [Myoviridae sp. ctk251]MCZ3689865.1 BppU family phage baseplate upper protein [Lactobacillus mulieris]MCZ3695868.1 BppU family phage baseplate upper protein [Lactobacillus mulieris]MCZ3701830.1 BppU family phage baseplate upper protein [Lactobacillus mulieris]MCZ3703479.1 BppU family phage baseplate upper protein [Lactobacillus mulieris]
MSETDKITLPILELDLQKTTTYVARPFRLTQGDKGYWQAFHLSVGFQPYTITADKLCFAGTKPDGQLIDITNEPSRFELRDGVWYFKLPDELAQAVGTFTGYFYVVQGGTTVASTTKFAYEILAKFGEDEASNSYVSIFNDLRDKFSQIIESSRTELNNWTSLNNKAKSDLDQLLKDLKTQTDNWLKAKTSEVEALIAKYNSKYNELVSQWNNQITTQQSRWQSQLNQQQSDFNSQKARIDSEYRQQLENLKSQLNSELQTQKQAQQASFDSFKADLTNRISQAKSDIDSIQTVIPILQKKIAEISLNSFSKADARSAVSDQVTEITGNLIDPNLNNWSKSDAAQQAFKTINFSGSTNEIIYQGVSGTEIIYTKLNLELYKHYKLRFRFTPKSDIRDLQNGTNDKIKIAIWRTLPGIGPWGGEQGTPNLTSQIKDIAINQDKFYEVGFYSDNAKELYFAFNFHNVQDNVSYNFSISSISVVNIDNTIQSLPKSVDGVKPDSSGNINLQAFPSKAGAGDDDLFSFRNIQQLRIYDGTGQNVKNVPFKNNWFSVIVNMHSNWGTLTYLGQDGSIWTNICNGDTWGTWLKQASTYELNSKVNIADSLNRGLIDQGTTWQQIFGNDALNTNTGHLTVFKNSSNDYRPYIYGYSASGIAFGAGDTRGVLSVRWDQPGIMVAGGNGNGPKWARELAIKDDFANYYNKPEIDAKFANTGNVKRVQNHAPDGNGNVNIPLKVAFGFDVNSGSATDLRDLNINGYWAVDQDAIGKLLREGLPAKYAAKSETDSKIQALQNRCEALETQLTVLKGQMSNLLSVINVSDGSLNVSGNLIVKHGNIQNYWGGVDQYIAYSPSGVKRGCFGVWDNGTFQARGN